MATAVARNEIISSAERLIVHYGHRKTTIADIGRDLGMSTANIYRFFSSREELLAAVCSRALEKAEQAAQCFSLSPLGAPHRLREFLRTNRALQVRMRVERPNLYELMVCASDSDHKLISEHLAKIGDHLATLIADGVQREQFSKTDAAIAAKNVIDSTMILWHPRFLTKDVSSDRDSHAALIDFVVSALVLEGRKEEP